MTAPIRVVLADDEALTRGAVSALLELEEDLRIVAEAGTGDDAVQQVGDHRPDVAVLDVEMPGRDGAEVAEWVAANLPATRCIILTRHTRPSVLRRALAAGATGFVTKSAPASLLAQVIRTVHAGGRYVDPELAMTALTTEECPLTDRELDVLRSVDPAGTAADIAQRLHLSAGTVRNYLSSAMHKLGVRSRSEAVQKAADRGWL